MIRIDDLTRDDFETVAAWLSDGEINRWLVSEWRGREFGSPMIAVMLRNPRNRIYLISCDDQPCGLVGFSDIDAGDRTANLWYLIGDRSFGGRGVTTEAVRLAIEKGFGELDLASITAWIMADNQASRRVLEKNGMREAGTLRQATNSDGKQVDRIYFDLVPSDLES